MISEFFLVLGCTEISLGFSGWHLQQLDFNRGWGSLVLPCTMLTQVGFFTLRALKGGWAIVEVLLCTEKILLCSKLLLSWS